MTPSGPVEKQVAAWLDTLDASGPQTIQTMPTATIVPSSRDVSTRRAAQFLAQLAERGRPIELRTGKVIGEGGMGIVREAEQVALGRVVAIKTLKAGRTDPRGASDLLREAWVTGALEHPNVVPVHHLEIDDALLPLLILKRVDGVEWSALCNDAAEVQRRFGATDLLAWNLGILNQVLNALRFAHARGVIHRDLKPSNVMIGNFGEVYLLDWGIAVATRDDGTQRFPLASEATEIAGTPSYMAPEMLGRGEGPGLTERTDVYLAGAVLFELVAGHPPHQGETALAIMTRVVLSRPRIPREVPGELAQICLRAMQPDPAERYESIEALQLALQSYLEHRGSSRLAASATELLDKLLALTRERDRARSEEIYRLLATCRFAFHQALAVWPANADARTGITLGTVAVAEYELACGDARAAVTLLSELDDSPALLATAQAAADADVARHTANEQRAKEADPTVHKRTREIAVALGIFFTLVPLAGALRGVALQSHAQLLVWSGGCFVVLSFVAFSVRNITKTAINRHVFAASWFLFFAQFLLGVGAWRLGIPHEKVQVLNLFTWAVISGMFALAIDRWLAITSLSYFVMFLIGAGVPEQRLYLASAGNLVLTVVMLWRWRPAQQQRANEQRQP